MRQSLRLRLVALLLALSVCVVDTMGIAEVRINIAVVIYLSEQKVTSVQVWRNTR
jgi:hypothetical protein